MSRPAILAAFATLTALGAQAQVPHPDSTVFFASGASQLGAAPRLDPWVAIAPSALPKSVSSVAAIDTSNRAAVVAAYYAYYSVAQPALGFTGNVAACNPGTISTAYQEWLVTRINFVRAMAGVPGNMVNDTTKNAQEQAAALMFAANGTISHSPPSNWTCYTSLGSAGAGSSNISVWYPAGGYDPLELYMDDDGTGNEIAGHRRWILDSSHASFAVGDATDGGYEGNALYAFGQGGSASVPNGIPWPPRGYVPLDLFPVGGMSAPRWSFGLPNADFSTATVTVTANGSPVAVSVVSSTAVGFADNTIVWEMPYGYGVTKGATYNVTVSGVKNASQSTYSYQILPFDPADFPPPPPTFAMTVTRSGSGSGSVSSNPSGISCGATCSMNVNSGSTLALTATASPGSVFAGWTGACTGLGTCSVTATAASSVDAKFVPTSSFSLSMNASPVAFGGQSMSTTSPVVQVTLVNASTQSVTLSGITTSDAQFAQTNNCGATLAAGAGCMLSLTFTPNIAAGPLLTTAAAAGMLSVSAKPAAGSASTFTNALSGTGEKSLVSHYYRSLLNRAPDSGGKSFWESEAVRVMNLGANVNEAWFALAMTFVNSAEYSLATKSDTQFTTDLYRTFYNRAPDASGLTYWTGQLGSGLPREVLLASFLFSTEFGTFTQGIFGNTSVRAEYNTVMDFYRGLLGRLPDNAGFAAWLQIFQQAQCQGASAVTAQANSISSAFVGSAEYAGRGRSNAQYVGDLYNAFLRRGGDLAGVQFWISQLDAGAQSRDQVRQQFVASTEFQARVQAVIVQGCGL
jgi:hypothetical protein